MKSHVAVYYTCRRARGSCPRDGSLVGSCPGGVVRLRLGDRCLGVLHEPQIIDEIYFKLITLENISNFLIHVHITVGIL